MKQAMIRYGLVAIGLIIGIAIGVVANAQEVPRWQHSIFNPSVSVDYYYADDEYHSNAFNGLGYMLAWTVYDRGNLNVLGLGAVNVIRMSTEQEMFTWTFGPNLNFGGNFGVGVGWLMIDTANQRGLAIGKGRGAPDSFWFSLHLPLNGGGLINAWKQ